MEKVIEYLVYLIVLIILVGAGLAITGLMMLGIQSIFTLLF